MVCDCKIKAKGIRKLKFLSNVKEIVIQYKLVKKFIENSQLFSDDHAKRFYSISKNPLKALDNKGISYFISYNLYYK